MNILFFIYSLTLAYSPTPTTLVTTSPYGYHAYTYSAYSTTLSAGLQLGTTSALHAYILGSAQTWEHRSATLAFNPTLAYYKIRAGITTPHIDLAFTHLCIHPVFSSTYNPMFGGGNTLTLTFHGETPLF